MTWLILGLIIYLIYRGNKLKNMEKRIKILEKRVDKLEIESRFLLDWLDKESRLY